MTSPTYLPPSLPYGRPAPRPVSPAVRIHSGIALGVIGVVGSVVSMIAFFVVAFMGDGCGFADSPPICSAPLAAWVLMTEPALVTMLAGAAALVGVVTGGGRQGHAWPIAAWVVWVAGGLGWVVLMTAVGAA